MLRTNTIAPFLVARAALPHVIERKGSLIGISSAAALTAGPHSAAYCTSKAAVSMLMKTIAIDSRATGHALEQRLPRAGCAPTWATR